MAIFQTLIILSTTIVQPTSTRAELSVGRAREVLNWAVSPATKGGSRYFDGKKVEARWDRIEINHSVVRFNGITGRISSLQVSEYGLPTNKNLTLNEGKDFALELHKSLKSPYTAYWTSYSFDERGDAWRLQGKVKYGEAWAGHIYAEVDRSTGAITAFSAGNPYDPPKVVAPRFNENATLITVATELRNRHAVSDFELQGQVHLSLFNPAGEINSRSSTPFFSYFSLPGRYKADIDSYRNAYCSTAWIKPTNPKLHGMRLMVDPWTNELISITQIPSGATRPYSIPRSIFEFHGPTQIISAKKSVTVHNPTIERTDTPCNGIFAHSFILQLGRRMRFFTYDEKLNRLKISVDGEDHYGRPESNLEMKLRSMIARPK